MEYLNSKLIGEQLSSVEFVQDYLQLHFDGRNLIVYIWPEVTVNNQRYIYGELNYRNMLCALIGLLVIKIEVKEKKEFKLFFGGNSSISINLDTDNPEIVAEIAIFQDTVDGSLYVFE